MAPSSCGLARPGPRSHAALSRVLRAQLPPTASERSEGMCDAVLGSGTRLRPREPLLADPSLPDLQPQQRPPLPGSPSDFLGPHHPAPAPRGGVGHAEGTSASCSFRTAALGHFLLPLLRSGRARPAPRPCRPRTKRPGREEEIRAPAGGGRRAAGGDSPGAASGGSAGLAGPRPPAPASPHPSGPAGRGRAGGRGGRCSGGPRAPPDPGLVRGRRLAPRGCAGCAGCAGPAARPPAALRPAGPPSPRPAPAPPGRPPTSASAARGAPAAGRAARARRRERAAGGPRGPARERSPAAAAPPRRRGLSAGHVLSGLGFPLGPGSSPSSAQFCPDPVRIPPLLPAVLGVGGVGGFVRVILSPPPGFLTIGASPRGPLPAPPPAASPAPRSVSTPLSALVQAVCARTEGQCEDPASRPPSAEVVKSPLARYFQQKLLHWPPGEDGHLPLLERRVLGPCHLLQLPAVGQDTGARSPGCQGIAREVAGGQVAAASCGALSWRWSERSAPDGGAAQGRGGEGDLSGSAAPGSRLGPPPPAPARSCALCGAGRGERRVVPSRPSCSALRPGPPRPRPVPVPVPVPAPSPPGRAARNSARAGAAPGRARGAGSGRRGARGGGGERGGRAPGSARPARRPAPGSRAAINGARGGGGGGGIWRAGRRLEARAGGGGAAARASGDAAGGRLGVKFRGAPGADARRSARRWPPPPVARDPPPRSRFCLLSVEFFLLGAGAQGGSRRAVPRGARRLSPRTAVPGRCWSGARGRAAAAASPGALTGVPFVPR
ncbi:collagen alpha-1(I) chain-like [Sus scrofa]|uniref:collagen alpha-1(I) chain-like n=1 Tax=Sus scrofa TaxID=9823 RepID=UPI000A2B4F3F|nr:collagen alpha-1(I) chain-like [Sus scrofa]